MNAHEWIAEYFRAWNDRDPSYIERCYTEDAVYRSHPMREPHVGHDGIRAYWGDATSTQKEVDVRYGRPIVEGNRAAVEWWALMRDGDEELTLPGIVYLIFAPDGRCRELRETWHLIEGRHEPPSGWGL